MKLAVGKLEVICEVRAKEGGIEPGGAANLTAEAPAVISERGAGGAPAGAVKLFIGVPEASGSREGAGPRDFGRTGSAP